MLLLQTSLEALLLDISDVMISSCRQAHRSNKNNDTSIKLVTICRSRFICLPRLLCELDSFSICKHEANIELILSLTKSKVVWIILLLSQLYQRAVVRSSVQTQGSVSSILVLDGLCGIRICVSHCKVSSVPQSVG